LERQCKDIKVLGKTQEKKIKMYGIKILPCKKEFVTQCIKNDTRKNGGERKKTYLCH